MTETKLKQKSSQNKGTTKSKSQNEQDATNELNNELMSLYDLCEMMGTGEKELLSPLLFLVSGAKLKRRLRNLSVVVGVVAVLYCLVYLPPIANVISFLFRKYLIRALPMWDWTEWYYSDCLVYNPYYIGNQLLEEDCSVCESLESLNHIVNASHTEVSQQYLQNDIPFIVKDGTRDWHIMHTENLFFDNITDLYLTSPRLKGVAPCSLVSNLRGRRDDLRGVLRKIQSHQPLRWFIHWENCNKQAAKALRSLYTRPYFLPPMVDLSDSNWVLMSSNYLGKLYRELPSVTSMLVVAQIRGYNMIQLTAREPCQGMCPVIQDTLAEGEVLVFTDFLWKFEYIPGPGSDNLAIAVGGFWE